MLWWIFRECRRHAGRTAVTVAAIAAILAEILILEGFVAGMDAQLRNTVVNRGGDVIVTQAGIGNFIAARSILPQLTRARVEALDGVRAAHPMTAISVIHDRGGRKTPMIVFVYDTAGGPKAIVEGTLPSDSRDIVIDRAVAARHGYAPGDTIEISEFAFTISGISEDTSAFFTPFAFITYDGMIDFYFESDIADDIATFPLLSFLLVETEPGTDPRVLAGRITREIEDSWAYLPADLAERDVGLGREMIGPILGLLLGVSYVIGALVIGIFMFAAVKGRLRALGVLRALGFSPVRVGVAVVAEAMALTVIAFPLAVLLAQAISGAIRVLAPIYLLLPLEPTALVRTLTIALALAALGALAPVLSAARLDPAIVFRG